MHTNVFRFTTLNFTMINPEMLLNIQTSLHFSGTISCTILFIYNYIYVLLIRRNHKHTHNPDNKKTFIQILTLYIHQQCLTLFYCVLCLYVYASLTVSLCVYYNILPHFADCVTVCAVSTCTCFSSCLCVCVYTHTHTLANSYNILSNFA